MNIWMSKTNIKYFIATVISVFVSYLFVVMTDTAVLPMGLLFAATAYYIYKRDKRSVFFFVACTVAQGITLILFAPYITSRESNGLIIIKELLVYGLAVIGFVKKRREREDIYFMLFCAIVAIDIIKASSLDLGIAGIGISFRLAIAGLRQIMVIFACYYMGKAIKVNSNSLKAVTDFIVFMAVFVVVIGFFMYAMEDSDWLSIGYGEYWNNRTSGNVAANFINFYSWDLGFKLKRVVSTFVNPIACAHFIGMGFVIEFILNRRRFLIKSILAIGLLMCISKSSLVLIMSVIVVKYYSKIKNTYLRFIFVLICVVLGMFGLVFLSDYVGSLSQNTAIGNHFNAFLYGLRNGSLLGQGLGTVGYNAQLAGLTNYDEGFNESFLALCIAQIGIAGILFIYLFLASVAKRTFVRYSNLKSDYILISLILFISIIIESLFSASALSMLGTGIYFIYAGMIATCFDTETKLKEERS